MSYIYFLLWLSFKNITKADGKKYRGYERAQFTGYVVGGVEVPITMYPHVSLLFMAKVYLCGGSIVSDRVIVTAGHCAFNPTDLKLYSPDAFEVYLGSASSGNGKKYEVCKAVPHELYNNKRYHDYFYDIAVLMLTRRIIFGPTIQKIRIAPNTSWRKEKYDFTVAGFGLMETDGSLPENLLATRMHYVNSRTCNQSQATGDMIVPDHMFCMIGQRWTSDCHGDSGSGIIWRGYLVGVVSTGRDDSCGADMVPSMYTDVTYFRKWIKSKIKKANSLPNKTCHRSTKHRKLVKYKSSYFVGED